MSFAIFPPNCRGEDVLLTHHDSSPNTHVTKASGKIISVEWDL